jgi:hypothetical protein
VRHPVDLAQRVVIGVKAELFEPDGRAWAHVTQRIPAVDDYRPPSVEPLGALSVQLLEHDATTQPIAAIAEFLQDTLGQRMTAYLAGLNDVKQIGRYRKPDGPTPTRQVELRLREGYKVVRMLLDCYDQATARNWLFGTNSRLDDQAPIGLLRNGTVPEDFVAVIRAARQFASADV